MMHAQSQPSNPPRIDYLESIRGLAAVQVLLLHCVAMFAPSLVYALPASGTIGGYIHLSPLYFLYDGYSAVYIFFALSGFVLSRSFVRQLDRPVVAMVGRAIRLGLPAIVATLVSAAILIAFGRPNAEVAILMDSDWIAKQWNPDLSIVSLVRDGIGNALFLGYRGLSSVPFLAPWQQPIEQSYLAPLWTLSTEFYGSLLVLLLCICTRRSRALWWTAVLLGAVYFIRSPYICFVVGHAAAMLLRGDAPSMRTASATAVIAVGVFMCVIADIGAPEWLRALCQSPTQLLFPGQMAKLQFKAYGAILVLAGLVSLPAARMALSHPQLVFWSRLSFPLYLVHWPILFGPTAAIFLILKPLAGLDVAALIAILVGIALSFVASLFFLPVDRFALEASRRWRRHFAGGATPRAAALVHNTRLSVE